jgi:hypothetical protein
MILTDEAALKLLRRANSDTLYEYILLYPEDEINDRSDMTIVLDELEHLLWMYEEEGSLEYENLELSLKILEYPDVYTSEELDEAKDTVNEYKRVKEIVQEYYYGR